MCIRNGCKTVQALKDVGVGVLFGFTGQDSLIRPKFKCGAYVSKIKPRSNTQPSNLNLGNPTHKTLLLFLRP